jgi:hypothetical protein
LSGLGQTRAGRYYALSVTMCLVMLGFVLSSAREMVDMNVSCFENETCGQLVSGMALHQFLFDNGVLTKFSVSS